MKIFIAAIVLVSGCQTAKDAQQLYENQIGDTPFNQSIDNYNFKFCDSTNVLHKRAYIRYTGGEKALEKEFIEKYVFQTEHRNFSGHFIIRFAVNCNNQTGRFRIQILDTNFKKANCPKKLEDHILSISKSLKDWNHAYYREEHYDGYRFINIKIENGKIVKS